VDAAELQSRVGCPVIDRNGKPAGVLDAVFDDRTTGRPGWIGVRTGVLRHQLVLVPADGAELLVPSLRVPWTRGLLRGAPGYGEADRRGRLGLGEYRAAIPDEKAREVSAYYCLRGS
jgi:hypothetical protein